MITPSFKNTTETEYPIDNFEVKGATDAMTTIQVLDAEGQVTGMYYWYNAYQELPAGWFDVTGLTPAGITLKPGEAVFFNTSESNVTVLSSGEVPGVITHAVQGFAMLGNGSPVTIDVDAMTVTGATDAMTTIQILDFEGQVTGMYYWYNSYQKLPAGWFDVTGLTPAGIALNPGDSVIFTSNESNVSMSIPAAIQ